ncbi:cupin domain-containing protein [Variovorax sp. J22G21]|uniref:cupin domain-containing protein n=1 Tax=Variovorax fucosicus TaxID=3053517 RepID=UPI0025749016|nr:MULTISPECIES: cupin domain-containing protein [unclassified Variovorax]MDM0037855.1 cupin domain-containing protein [Variovorax sp. J22R193]MDM0056476.1 cupin domain-containing protein [Variovorax sp. J22G47]MDM0062631.1 cupin domain-containing protein [Variovorax sp. J22G21]
MASDLSSGEGAPLAIRRVVTGHDRVGASEVALDTRVPRTDAFQHIPGMVSRLVWASAPVPGLPFDGVDPTPAVADFVPAAGATRFLIVTFPPDSVFAAPDFDPAAAAAENLAISPGLAECFEPDGMHATPTMDYGIVLDGEIWLELDEGRSTHLQRHDVVVQHGTRHAWRNKSERPATLAFVLIGASAAARNDTPFDTGNAHD